MPLSQKKQTLSSGRGEGLFFQRSGTVRAVRSAGEPNRLLKPNPDKPEPKMLPKLSDLNFGFAEGPAGVCRPQGPPQKTPRLRQRPRGFDNLLTGSGGCLCRGALSSGTFRHYLSGPAAVATAGEEIAAAPADGRPQRISMRIDRIAQLR
jgi:hypothetical protein